MTVLLLVLLWQRTPIARRRLRKRIESLERQLFPAWFEPVKTAKAIVEKKTKEMGISTRHTLANILNDSYLPTVSKAAGYTLASLLRDYYLPPFVESLGRCPKCGGRLEAGLNDTDNFTRTETAYITVRCAAYQDVIGQNVRYIDPSSITYCRAHWAAAFRLPVAYSDNPEVVKIYLEQAKFALQETQKNLITLLDTERGLNGSTRETTANRAAY